MWVFFLCSKLWLDYRNWIFDFEGVDENVYLVGFEYIYDIVLNWMVFFDVGVVLMIVEDEEV